MSDTIDFLPPEQYYATLPKKRMAAMVILLNSEGEVLIVKPKYRDKWLLPGGVIEKDESPFTTAQRECTEEIGISPVTKMLLVVNYIKKLEYKSDAIHFVFKGEILSESDLGKIVLDKDEIETYEFASFKNAREKTSYAVSEMLGSAEIALRDNQTVYMEGSTKID